MPTTPAMKKTRSNSKATPNSDHTTQSQPSDVASKSDLQDLKNHITSLFKTEIETVCDKLVTLEERLKNFEYSILTIKEEQTKQALEIKQLKKQLSDRSVSAASIERHEMMHEIDERLRRRTNVIIAGIEELTSGSILERQVHDEENVKRIAEELNVQVSVSQTTRIGVQRSGGKRLLRVTLRDEESRWQLLRSAKSLRSTTHFKQVFINPDRTPMEQLMFREYSKEIQERRANGEDVVFYGGRVMKRSEVRGKKQNF